MLNRNLSLLFFCQLIAVTGSVVMVTLGSIIGAQLTTSPALATLPISLTIVTTAVTTIPAAIFMRRYGRRWGFALGCVTAMAAALLTLVAIGRASFVGFTCAMALFGINMAFAQQYRFAAIESAEPSFAGRAVSFVLLGAVGGALLGPTLVKYSSTMSPDAPYGLAMGAIAGCYLLALLLVLGLNFAKSQVKAERESTGRPLSAIVRQPVFIVAVFGGTIGYGVMSFLMTATPLSMHEVDGYSLAQTAGVIQAHVLGMYLPSLVSGWLIDRLGVVKMMIVGALTLVGALATGMDGHTMGHYTVSLILLGVGWNFLYVGGTTMLTFSYKDSERFRAQAVNEFCVFGTAASASLLAGTTMHWFGWFTTAAVPLPLLAVVLLALFWVRTDPLLRRAAPAAGPAAD
ncbi:MAG: MFS transporter [Lysobacterales bacterium]